LKYFSSLERANEGENFKNLKLKYFTGSISMILSAEDGKLYYELWLPLLDFVNKKYEVNKKLKKIAGAQGLDATEVKEVADKLWDDVSVIDEYLLQCKAMTEEHKEIIASWKRCVRGRFMMERHLKKGSILISMENEEVYQVCGIKSSLEEMFYYAPLPLMIEATLMPFRDVIITDGLIMPYNILIGRTMARTFKDVYMTAKKDGVLHKTL